MPQRPTGDAADQRPHEIDELRERAPKARRSQLVIKELASETLVYDESNHQAHCLNQTAAFVWKHCDGRKSIPTLARLVEEEMNATVSEQTVRLAIKQLDESLLLEPSAAKSIWAGVSRREMVRTLGIAAVALPIITSVVAPTAARRPGAVAGMARLAPARARVLAALDYPVTEEFAS